jgi:D-3-phosphoglycerate dehydrogenase / 2-oxoglutarate reductase
MNILIADKYPEAHLERFKHLGCEITYSPSASAGDLPKLIAGHKVLIVRSKKVTAETLRAADQLALVLRAGAGVNTIDVSTASELGIFVANCPGKNSIAVAELVFALLLGVDRRIAESTADLRAHKWNKKEYSKADGVFGKTLGIIGVGSIACEVIIRARAFGLKVIAWSPSLTAEKAAALGVEFCPDMNDVFRRADIVSLHTALKPGSRKLINATHLALMKPNAILINTARGEIVDQAALLEALQERKIRAGLDVFDPEPAEGSGDFNDPILDAPNLCGTHHIGASTEQAQNAIAEEAFRVVSVFLRSGEVPNCVNLAKRTPAKCQLIIRHYDRVGVLAFVLEQIRARGINVEEVQNIIFEGAAAASCRIQLMEEPAADVLAGIRSGNPDIISVEVIRLAH